MKKRLKTLISIILPTALCAGAVFAFSAVAANKYDVTGDGRVNSHDLVNMMKYLSGEIKYDPDTTESDKVPDVTKDPDTTEKPEVPKDTDKPVIPDDPKDTDKPVIPDDPKDTDTTPTEPDIPAPPVIHIEGPEEFPGEDLPFDLVGVGLVTYDCDNESTLIFDDAAKTAEYLRGIHINPDQPEEAQKLLDAVSVVDTAKKRIIVLNYGSTAWTDYFSNLRQVEKLSLSGGKLGMLYINRDHMGLAKDCAEGRIVTVVTVDRTATASLSARPDVERYMYSPFMNESIPISNTVTDPEAFPGTELPCEVICTAFESNVEYDTNLIFDDPSLAVSFLKQVVWERDNSDLAEKLKLISEINTEEKRIVVLSLPCVYREDCEAQAVGLEKLSIIDGKLGAMCRFKKAPLVDGVNLITVATVDRDAAEALSRKPEVERYMYTAAE